MCARRATREGPVRAGIELVQASRNEDRSMRCPDRLQMAEVDWIPTVPFARAELQTIRTRPQNDELPWAGYAR